MIYAVFIPPGEPPCLSVYRDQEHILFCFRNGHTQCKSVSLPELLTEIRAMGIWAEVFHSLNEVEEYAWELPSPLSLLTQVVRIRMGAK